MYSKLRINLLISLLILMYGCSEGTSTQSIETNIPRTDQGEVKLDVIFLRGPDIHSTENISLILKNLSDKGVNFPYDMGVRIWAQGDDSWIEVNSMVQYRPYEDRILDPFGSFFSEMAVSIRPDLTDYPLVGKTNFKAILAGHLCEDDTIVVEKEISFSISP